MKIAALSLFSALLLMTGAAGLTSGAFPDANVKEIRWGVRGGSSAVSEEDGRQGTRQFATDIATAICADLKVRCTFVRRTTDDLILALNRMQIDGVIEPPEAMLYLDEVSWSDPYYTSSAQLVVRKDSQLMPQVLQLQGKAIGVSVDTVFEVFAKKHWSDRGVRVVVYADSRRMYADLVAGQLDGVLQDNVIAATEFLRTPEAQAFELAGSKMDLGKTAARIAMRRADAELRLRINRALWNLRVNGTYDQIRQKYWALSIE